MSQHYSDPTRAEDMWSLPDVEVFYAKRGELELDTDDDPPEPSAAGWYYWFCFPGCLPDSDPVGPFSTKAEALADAQREE